jgi:hypothetical protein
MCGMSIRELSIAVAQHAPFFSTDLFDDSRYLLETNPARPLVTREEVADLLAF